VYLLRYKQQKRYISTTLPILDERSGRPDFFTSFLSREEQDPNEQHSNYSYKTAKQLQRNLLPPVRTKMLVRDFIEDSLYNPNYGFRSKQSLGGHVVVDDRVGDEVLSLLSSQQGGGRNLQQIKYRLTEMVKPWYGHAIAKYMVSEYKLNLYPHRDLIVYEMGGGNKRLMTTILDYIQQHEPHVYKRTRYNLIEPFPNKALRKEQQKHQCIDIIQQDILQWSTPVLDHCFFLGIEAIVSVYLY
jgi:hypothetical protein